MGHRLRHPGAQLFIDGRWLNGSSDEVIPVINPALGELIGEVRCAAAKDVAAAIAAAEAGFYEWRKVAAFERYRSLQHVASNLRARAEALGALVTLEEGKPLAESTREVLSAADIVEWCAEEARRAYGRTIPARLENVLQMELKEPVGVVAAFSPWNLPISQATRKLAAALAAGCSIVLKAPQDAPASCAGLVAAFADAGIPNGAINLLFGDPAELATALISHPTIRKVSFTGSTSVGKQLAMLAGRYMKRTTMELGGHAPALVFADAYLDSAAAILCANKYRNAGQLCVAPTRILVQEPVYRRFIEKFLDRVKMIKVGDGSAAETSMGPLVRQRRVDAMEAFVADAIAHGASLAAGGRRIHERGYFFAPTVLTEVPIDARVMNEEPFGPVALVSPFADFAEAIREANRLPYGLAAYAYTTSAVTAAAVSRAVESGMISINHHGLGLPEVRFGGVKDSGHGTEGGADAIEAYMNTKYVTEAFSVAPGAIT
ncbi:MAG: NAD-dependent succinate-semialdehyde dehydrogenase [Steroidobacteraceae bacterium]